MPALVAWVGIMRCPASSNSNPVSRWSDLLRETVRWDHWASDFCRTASNSARSMIGGCSPGRISFLYLIDVAAQEQSDIEEIVVAYKIVAPSRRRVVRQPQDHDAARSIFHQ